MNAIWVKVIEAMVRALLPQLLKLIEEWLAGLSEDELAKLMKNAVEKTVA